MWTEFVHWYLKILSQSGPCLLKRALFYVLVISYGKKQIDHDKVTGNSVVAFAKTRRNSVATAVVVLQGC